MIARNVGSLLLVVAEAVWCSLLLESLANGQAGPDRPPVDLPFLAIALPAAVAVLVMDMIVGGRRARLVQWVLAFFIALMLAAVTGELVSSLTPGVALWTAPALPVAVRAMTWASVSTVLAWGRGAWLGAAAPSMKQASASCLLGSVVVVVVLAVRTAVHSPAFGRATADIGWLLIVFFVAGVTAVAWAHERSVEPAATSRTARGPGVAWLAVMAVPLAVLVAVAFLAGGGGGLRADAKTTSHFRVTGHLGLMV